MRVAIIGAGLSGLTCAQTLNEGGHQVTVFEKARGPGGRASRRRQNGFEFDHGAQYFTARSEDFQNRVDRWVADSVIAPWTPRIGVADEQGLRDKQDHTPRWVGTPGMSALGRDLAAGLTIHNRTRIGRVRRSADEWVLNDDTGATRQGRYDALVVTAPPEQAVAFLNHAPQLQTQISPVAMNPCWAVMASFETPLSTDHDALFVNTGHLSWAARNNSKPGRPETECWVLHGSRDWSRTHLEAEPGWVADTLLLELALRLEIEPQAPAWRAAHRWRYALADPALEAACLVDPASRTLVCGDWCNGSRIEGAYGSGRAAARWLTNAG